MHLNSRVYTGLLVLTAVCYSAASTSVAQTAIEPVSPWPGQTTEQIINSLKPTATGGGIRGIPAAPAGTPQGAASTAALRAPSVSLFLQFPVGSAELTTEAIHVLDDLGKALNDQALAGYRFRIEGHTDTVGTRDYNLRLSERRAAAVVYYLADRFHIDRNRLLAVGMGKDGPLVATPDQTPEPRNRRVMIINIGS